MPGHSGPSYKDIYSGDFNFFDLRNNNIHIALKGQIKKANFNSKGSPPKPKAPLPPTVGSPRLL